MKINVLKFGGSSVKDNICLKMVAEKIIKFKEKGEGVVAVVSAQGKRTDELIKAAKELGYNGSKRELDFLLSIGEMESAAKLSIVLNGMGFDAVALNGLQAGIETSSDFGKAKIININTNRILKEVQDRKIVIVTGFQGVDENNNFTTLGKGGSDTSCVALAAKLGADKCYIFSDVDGIYFSDPRVVKDAKKLSKVAYADMENASFEGAKVLCDRSVSLADKYGVKIIAKSTFNENDGTEILGNVAEKNLLENNIASFEKNEFNTKNEENKAITKNKDAESYKGNSKMSNKIEKEKNEEKLYRTENFDKLEEYKVKMFVKNDKILKAEINEVSIEKLDLIISEINKQKINIKKLIITDEKKYLNNLEESKKNNTSEKNREYGNLKNNERNENKNQVCRNIILIFNDFEKADIEKILSQENVNAKIEQITEYSFVGTGISNSENLINEIFERIKREKVLEKVLCYEVNSSFISVYVNKWYL